MINIHYEHDGDKFPRKAHKMLIAVLQNLDKFFASDRCFDVHLEWDEKTKKISLTQCATGETKIIKVYDEMTARKMDYERNSAMMCDADDVCYNFDYVLGTLNSQFTNLNNEYYYVDYTE